MQYFGAEVHLFLYFYKAHGLTEGFLPPNIPTGQGDFGSLDQRNWCNGLQRDAAGKARSTRQLGFMEFSEVKIYGTCFDFAWAIFGDFGLEGLLAYQSSRCTLRDIDFV